MQRKPSSKKLSNDGDHLFNSDFKYKHDNPYHSKLEIFDKFVMRDNEGEDEKGKWHERVFENDYPIALEIGSGYGHFMLDFVEKNPKLNFVGMDHRFKRSFQLAKKLARLDHTNFRYLRARGERIEHLFAPNELDRIFYFFPDPWPKTRHHKERLFQESFLNQCHKVLHSEGKIFIKTDHDDYFDWMNKAIQSDQRFEKEFFTFDLKSEHPEHFLASFETKFEKIFIAKGIKIKAMVLKMVK